MIFLRKSYGKTTIASIAKKKNTEIKKIESAVGDKKFCGATAPHKIFYRIKRLHPAPPPYKKKERYRDIKNRYRAFKRRRKGVL